MPPKWYKKSPQISKAGQVAEWFKATVLKLVRKYGEVAEWLMAPVLKTGILARVSWVRIPPSPPFTCLETSEEVQKTL
jgi:hypothetical protein